MQPLRNVLLGLDGVNNLFILLHNRRRYLPQTVECGQQAVQAGSANVSVVNFR